MQRHIERIRHLARQPVIPVLPLVLTGFLCGSTVALLVRPAPLPSLWLLLALLPLIPCCVGWPKACLWAMPLVFLLLGWQHSAMVLLGPRLTHHVDGLVPPGQPVTLRGIVANMPEFDGRHSRWLLDCEALLSREGPPRAEGGVFVPARGLVRLTMAGPSPDVVRPGQPLLVMTRLDRPQNFRTPGAHDRVLQLAAQNIHRTGYLDSPNMLHALPQQTLAPLQRLRFGPERLRQDIARFMEHRLPSATAAIYQGLVIGSRAAIPEAIIDDYKASGCMHILVISGMHLSLLALMTGWTLTWLLQRSEWLMLHLPVRQLAAGLTAPLLLGYTLLAGGQVPVLRALVMVLLVTAALLLRRQHDMFHLLCAAALGLLIWQPLALGTASFQLSFAAVFGLIMIQPRLQRLFQEHASPHTPGPSLSPSLPRRLGRFVLAALLVSLAATLVTLPVMLHHFNQISLVGPLANLLVEPLLCLWALPLALLAIPCQAILPELAAALLRLGALGIDGANEICRIAAALPLARLHTISPSFGEISGYYGLLAVLFWRRQLGRLWSPLLAAALLLCLLPGLLQEHAVRRDRGMTVWYLDVGQGSASVIELPGGSAVLLDGGSSSAGASVGERVIAPFLRSRRVTRLKAVVLTHPDSDHSNGLEYILRHFRPETLWVSKETLQAESCISLRDTAGRMGIPLRVPTSGQDVLQHPQASLTVLHNPVADQVPQNVPKSSSGTNETGLVLRLALGRQALLFPGDIGAETERRVTGANSDLQARVLLAAHHGSRFSNSPALLRAVDPSCIVVSAGKGREMRFPSPGHLADWDRDGIKSFMTWRDGTIHCRVTEEELRLSPWRPAYAPPRPDIPACGDWSPRP